MTKVAVRVADDVADVVVVRRQDHVKTERHISLTDHSSPQQIMVRISQHSAIGHPLTGGL